jgi:hypothetical protein
MALLTCRKCGGEVRSSAWRCPHCGASAAAARGQQHVLIVLLVLGALAICLYYLLTA